MNRDSITLWIGAAGALILYLQNAGGSPSTWSYNDWLAFAAFVLAFVSGKLGTSPLPGKNDYRRVSGLRSWFVGFVLLSALSASACGTKALITPTPTAVEVQAVRRQAEVLATATKEASALALSAWRTADALYMEGRLSVDQMRIIDIAALQVSRVGLAFIETAQTATTHPQLQATARALLSAFDSFLQSLDSTESARIRAVLSVFRLYLEVVR